MNISPKQLITLREERGWSQEKLAAIASISERTVQRIERDGSCSLDTKMAIASAFEISPAELVNQSMDDDLLQFKVKTSWGGAVGLFVVGLATPLIALLTATDGRWEVASFLAVCVGSIALTVMHYGLKSTYELFDNSSWIVRYPTYVNGLNKFIVQAKSVIEYTYIVGVVSTVVVALTIIVHVPSKLNELPDFIVVVIRPLFYSILFVELWFRPYKKKMESMLSNQLENEKI